MASELKPCPFCGSSQLSFRSTPDMDTDGKFHRISCNECGASSRATFAMDACPLFFEELSKAWNTRPTPVAPVSPDATGKCGELVTVGEVSTVRESVAAFAGHMLSRQLKPGDLLCLRSQAEELLAAERAKYRDAMEKLVDSQRETLVWQQQAIDLKADNAALTAEISAISGHLDCEADSDSILHTLREIEADKAIYKESAEALEAKLAAAKDLISRAQEIIPGNYMHWHDFARAALGGKRHDS